MTRLRRFAPTAPAESPWNGWPNAAGIAGRMVVEQVAEWHGMRSLAAHAMKAASAPVQQPTARRARAVSNCPATYCTSA
ncbi:MAG: hypothetical protein WBM22_27600, partial [Pseudomonas fluorescens]